jgi:plastocyanin
MPARITHTIRVDFNHVFHDEADRYVDSIDYIPAVLWVQAGDEVQWISNYDLHVTFHKGSPFSNVRIQTAAEELSDPETVLTSTAKRGYSYRVNGAKMEGTELRFSGDPGCPELIVE